MSTRDAGAESRRRSPARGPRARTVIRRAAERCAFALQAAGLGVFEWDPRTDALAASEVFVALIGRDRGAGRGPSSAAAPPRTLAELLSAVHPEDREALEREIHAAAAERRAGHAEFRIVEEAGTRWISVRSGIAPGGSTAVESVVGLAEDVTARKRAEAEREALVRRERELRTAAEQTNRAKDEFLSLFSHELRSPLNAILGWNSILAAKRADDAEIAAVAARIERSARAQLKLVNDLLDFVLLGTGKLTIEPRPTKLASVAAAALDALRPASTAKAIELASVSVEGAGEVYGDAGRLQQVVQNLLSNAIKFTDSGGRIEVRVRPAGVFVELSVVDTGRGISAAQLPHLFDRGSTARHTPGLGLGLALVREIVALHGGSVSAASEGPGRGAAFTVRLPAVRAHAVARARDLPDHPLAGLSILVVDDEVDARTVVAETLRLEGARVTVSESAAAALEQLRSGAVHYDVVVTDIGMPREDGYSLVGKLRRAPYGEHVIVIALTGYASPRDRELALRAGFDAHVAKPVEFEHFVPLIAGMTRAARGAKNH